MAGSSYTPFLGRVTIFSIPGCRHCKRAKSYLTELGVPYSDVDLDSCPSRRDEMTERTGRHTVPQIFFNDKHVGGADELLGMPASDIQELIRYSRENPPNEKTPAPAHNPAADADRSVPSSSAAISCEIDKYYELIKKGRSGTTEPRFPAGDHTRGIRTHRMTFTGQELVRWLLEQRIMEIAADEAIPVARDMMSRLYFCPLSSKVVDFVDDNQILYRLLIDRRTTALNVGSLSVCDGASPGITAEQIRRSINTLYERFIDL